MVDPAGSSSGILSGLETLFPREILGLDRPTWTPSPLLSHPHGLLVSLNGPPPVPPEKESLLTAAERTFAALLPPRRRCEWTAGRICLISALESLALISPRDERISILTKPNGAPLLPLGATGSLSHKKNIFVAIVDTDRGQSVGVDLELVSGREEHLEKRILTAREQELLTGVLSPSRSHAVAVHFSAKESVYKALNEPVQASVDFRDIEISKWDPNKSGEIQEIDIKVRNYLEKGGHARGTVLTVGKWILTTAEIRCRA